MRCLLLGEMTAIHGIAAPRVWQTRQLLLDEFLSAGRPPRVLIAAPALVLQPLVQGTELKLALVTRSGVRLRKSLVEHGEMLDFAPKVCVGIPSGVGPVASPHHCVGAEIGVAEVPQGRGALTVRAGRVVVLSRLDHVLASTWVRDDRLARL